MFKFMKLIKLHSNIKYKIIAVLICCILLILVCLFQQSQNNIISGQIKRPEPGEEDLSTQINVLDSSGKVITRMDLTIKPRTLTETEVFEYFDRAYDEGKRIGLVFLNTTGKIDNFFTGIISTNDILGRIL